MHYNKGDYDLFTYIKNPEVFDVKNGMIEAMPGPGLGIEINEELVRQNAKETKESGFAWRNPVFRTPDGAVSEW